MAQGCQGNDRSQAQFQHHKYMALMALGIHTNVSNATIKSDKKEQMKQVNHDGLSVAVAVLVFSDWHATN